MALNSHLCADVPLSTYTLTHSLPRTITGWNQLSREAPETISQLFPSVSALFTDLPIDILSHDTQTVTG